MKIDIFNRENVYDFSESSIQEDLKRIKKLCQKINISLSDDEAYIVYHNWSEDYYAANWKALPESDLDLYEIMRIALNDLIDRHTKIDY